MNEVMRVKHIVGLAVNASSVVSTRKPSQNKANKASLFGAGQVRGFVV